MDPPAVDAGDSGTAKASSRSMSRGLPGVSGVWGVAGVAGLLFTIDVAPILEPRGFCGLAVEKLRLR